MDSVKDHESKFGKFYSEWAFTDNYKDFINANNKVYSFLKEALNEEQCPFVYYRISYGPAHTTYCVTSKPDWMTIDEAALVIDNANLCFGFRVSGNTIDIYTD